MPRFEVVAAYLNHNGDVDDNDDEDKGEPVRASFMQHIFPQHISLLKLQSWVKCRPSSGV